jgi:tRNA(Ile2) C34 agmatinyltransferase TiaS
MVKQTKQESRAEIDRLVKEALERKAVSVRKVASRREAKCEKCGAPNRVTIPSGEVRVPYKCSECGHKQRTM